MVAQSLQYAIGFFGLMSTVVGVSFWLAGLKIKGEISLEIANQLSAISNIQVKQQYEDTRLSEILVGLKGQMDKNTNDITQLGQEIDQVKGFLSSSGFTRRHKRPPSES